MNRLPIVALLAVTILMVSGFHRITTEQKSFIDQKLNNFTDSLLADMVEKTTSRQRAYYGCEYAYRSR